MNLVEETSIENQTGELKRKDGGIKQLERIIEEKSNSLVSFRSAVGSFQVKIDCSECWMNVYCTAKVFVYLLFPMYKEKPLEVNERIGQIDTHVYELEKQVFFFPNSGTTGYDEDYVMFSDDVACFSSMWCHRLLILKTK